MNSVARDPFDRIFHDLKSKNDDVRQRAAHDLRRTLEVSQRESSKPNDAQDVQRQVLQRASALVVSGVDTAERIGGIHALSALMNVKSEDTAQKTTRLANALRTVMRGTDVTAMVVAAQALGKLTIPGNALTAELVDSEVKSALESLQVDRQENRRFAAVLILRELAENSPTFLYQYTREILEVIWVALRDPKVLIREYAAQAVSAFFEITAARDAQLRDKWFLFMHNEIQKGFQLNTIETIHGSLLTLKELLLKGGMFMQNGTRYTDACDKIFFYKDHRELLIRREVTTIIPILAAYYPQEFSNGYLHKFMIHLQGQLRKEKDRNPAFVAIGKVASAVGSAIDPYLDSILVYIREGLSVKARIRNTNDAAIFECISMIAIAVGQTMTKYLDLLLDPMFACGLSDALTQALVDMAHYIPPARSTIQEKLLDLLSHVLCGRPFVPLGSPSHSAVPVVLTRDHRDPQHVEKDAELALALQTLGSFDFSDYILNEFVRDVVIRYVEDENAAIRKAAALTSCQIFVKDPVVHQVSRHSIRVVSTVIEKLLAVAIADPDPDIRHVVLVSLDARFDRHLAKAENIRSLFLALNDEVFANREIAMSIIGRLTPVNPAYIFPSLRKVLIQLLTEVEYSKSPRTKQESCQLISHLVNASSRLIKPYVRPIVDVLLPKVSDADETVASTALKAIGDLATIGGEDMESYIPVLMELIIENLQDLASTPKRGAALRTLGQLSRNAGYVIQPYTDYPQLLSILANMVNNEHSSVLRQETIKVIGILGALDPYKHQQIVDESPLHYLKTEIQPMNDTSLMMSGLTPSNEDFYPTVVINTLTNVLKDTSLTQLHQSVVDAIMNIYATMGLKCVGYLDKVVPGFLTVIQESAPTRVDGYFNQLSQLVRIVRQHIRPFLPVILETVHTFWETDSQTHSTILVLVESISRCLEGEFNVYLAKVLPLMLTVLEEDMTPTRAASERVLHAFLVFGSSAEEYMHLIIPIIVRMFEKPGQPHSIRKVAVETLGRLSRQVNISEYAARVVHPLIRVLAGNDTILKQAALETLCALIFQLGPDYLPFIPTVHRVLVAHRVKDTANYSLIVSKLRKGESLPQDLSPDDKYNNEEDLQRPLDISTKMLAVNQEHLKSAWEASQRSTREDWLEWNRRLSVELLKESPHQVLRACSALASAHAPIARALYNSAFMSCWTHLFPQYQGDLADNITKALSSPNVPPELLHQLLNLAEFMEHDDKALPIDIRQLGMYAGKCHAWAKALHYKELEFTAEQTPSAVEALISINNQLQQSDAAIGILRKAQSYQDVDMKESWYEKLQRWEEALASYQRREVDEPYSWDVIMGKMKCLHALGEWDVLSSLAEDKWSQAASDGHQRAIAPLAAAAAWGLERWELMDKYVGAMKLASTDRSFFAAILSIIRNQYDEAQLHIQKARDGLDTELSAILGESYNRAYVVIVRIQMVAELEEIITYRQNDKSPDKQETLRQTWSKRLKGSQKNVEVWQRMLKLRAIVLKPEQNMEMMIKFANLCRKSQRYGLAEKSLQSLVGGTKESLFSIPSQGTVSPNVSYAILKYMWSAPSGDHQQALSELKDFTARLDEDFHARQQEPPPSAPLSPVNGTNGFNAMSMIDSHASLSRQVTDQTSAKTLLDMQKLLARCHVKQGQWQAAMQRGDWQENNFHEILDAYSVGTRLAPTWYKAWHAWALANFEMVTSVTSLADSQSVDVTQAIIINHVVPAVQGFFKSISLSSASSLQDTLRLLTLWFAHGSHPHVNAAVVEGIATVNMDTWLEVIPQLIARINQANYRVRQSVHNLLCEVGRVHPQALVYPLTVSIKSDVSRRSRSAMQIMDSFRQHSPDLVQQADLVSHELIRIAVLWHEQWHEALEEASRLYFGDHNIDAMIECLAPCHELMAQDQSKMTLREISFWQTFGTDLEHAHGYIKDYQKTGNINHINQAWDAYYNVFKKISRQLPHLMSMELNYVSPKLAEAHDLALAVPGTYQSGKPVVKIASFEPVVTVIQSKQRPRRLTLRGSDGAQYVFLLKGHEDIRQDERVMQLFGLVNTLLANDPECLKRHLNIQRYAAIPLSTQSGLLGWVPNSDTLHVLIREYRDTRKILLNIEQRIMLQMAPDYDNLTLMQKVEVFSYAMDNTTGQDLYRLLWLKSKSSETWLDRRTNYIRSLGAMSMVGYILGLGDRHPSNLMLDRITGKIIHIDFGDCFEIAMHREKYPERVPFRLTRMLTFAMEVSNIEGSFRTTCENVMRVLRENKESLMAVLEAFIHDPLLTWRLNERDSPPEPSFPSERRASLMGMPTNEAFANMPHASMAGSLSTQRRRSRPSVTGQRPVLPNGGGSTTTVIRENVVAEQKEVQNARALQVLSRVKEKLTGRDFKASEELAIDEQVDKLINQATNLENLCQHYIGWCSFW